MTYNPNYNLLTNLSRMILLRAVGFVFAFNLLFRASRLYRVVGT